jgi:hypothetical protein
MVPDSVMGILLAVFGLVSGIAVSQYYHKKYVACISSGFFSAVLLLAVITLYWRNGIIKKELIEKDKELLASVEVQNVLKSLPEQDPNVPDQKMGGVIIEGRRNNMIPPEWSRALLQAITNVEVRSSRIVSGMDEQEYIFSVKPSKRLNITIPSNTNNSRKDYTFSFLCYNSGNDLSSIDLELGIDTEIEQVRSKIEFNEANTYMDNKKINLKVFRAEISHLFSIIPRTIKGYLSLTNNSDKELEFIMTFPMMEQGLFSSSPIQCGKERGTDFLSFLSINMPINEGTILFFFRPYWGAKQLTKGISPHLFDCVTNDDANGIRIYADSYDEGKLKVEIVRNGIKTIVTSDVVFVKEKVYSIAFRWNDNLGEILINGKTVSSAKKIPTLTRELLPKSCYIGSNPKSEDLAAFGTFRDLMIYSKWLTDRVIRAIIFTRLPIIFPEFEKEANLLSETARPKK